METRGPRAHRSWAALFLGDADMRPSFPSFSKGSTSSPPKKCPACYEVEVTEAKAEADEDWAKWVDECLLWEEKRLTGFEEDSPESMDWSLFLDDDDLYDGSGAQQESELPCDYMVYYRNQYPGNELLYVFATIFCGNQAAEETAELTGQRAYDYAHTYA